MNNNRVYAYCIFKGKLKVIIKASLGTMSPELLYLTSGRWVGDWSYISIDQINRYTKNGSLVILNYDIVSLLYPDFITRINNDY